MSKLKKAKIKLLKRLKFLPLISNKNNDLETDYTSENSINNYKPYLNKIFNTKLLLKQRLRYNYCLHDKNLHKLIKKIQKRTKNNFKLQFKTNVLMVRSHRHKMPDITMLSHLFNLLELRLDTVLTRIGCAESILHAKQLINHGHVFVNKKIIKYSNYICNINDIIFLNPKLEIKWNVFKYIIEPIESLISGEKYIPFFSYEQDFNVRIIKYPSEYLFINADIESLYGAFEYYK